MSLPFFHKNHTDISNHLDLPGELLNSPASSKDYILVIGPDLVRWEAVPNQDRTDTYLERLLKGMVVWCSQNRVIQNQDIIHDLHILLHKGALVPLTYRIEEYLAAAQLKEQCLRAVLNPYGQVEAIHYQLTRFPFRGYITTSYDTCIETAYEETQQGQLSKFYQFSFANAIDACRKKQPFILKLYGDLAELDSIKLGHRLLTGLYAEDVRQQLKRLFFETSAIFIGFDDADRDLTTLQSLVTDGYNDQQKHSTHTGELQDGIITKHSDQSSSDSTAHKISPGDRPPRPFISSQSQNIPSNGEQSEKETAPDTIRQEVISVPAFAEGQHKDNGTSTGSPLSSSGPSAGHDGRNGQSPNQSPKSPIENSELAIASTCQAQVPNFQSLIKSGDLQLPDYGVLGTFKLFLKSKCGHVDIEMDKDPGKLYGMGKPKKYTRVKKGREKEPRALIYIPGSTMTASDEIDIATIRGLCSAFSSHEVLIICTDSDKCSGQIKRSLEEFKQQNNGKECHYVLGQEIQCLLDEEDENEKENWINYLLHFPKKSNTNGQ